MRFHRALAVFLVLAPISLTAHGQYSIASVTFKHPGPYTTPELLAASGLEAGQSLMQDSLANAAQRLLNTGLFSDATIDYTGAGHARGIVVDLKPIPLDKLLPASFENFVWFTPEELTAGIHAHVPLYRGVTSDAGTLPDDIQAALQQMLAAKGITATLSHEVIEATNEHPLRALSFRVEQPSVRLGMLHISMLTDPSAAAALKPGIQQAANLVIVGTLAEVVEDQFTRLFAQMGITDIGYLPARRAGLMPAVGPNTKFLLAQPFLAGTMFALNERGATRIAAPMPLGVEGTTAWFEAAASSMGVAGSVCADALAAPAEVPQTDAAVRRQHYRYVSAGPIRFTSGERASALMLRDPDGHETLLESN